jgi:ubiquitin C-terminal hydrolase
MSSENNENKESNANNENKKLIIPALGFQNTGAICYFNSLLQCILSSTNFLRFILSDNHDPRFLSFFQNICNDLWNARFTTELLQSIGTFQPNQSSSEYFLMIMDALKWERLFECRHQQTKECKSCGHKNSSTDISYNVLINESLEEFMKTECQLDNVMCDGCKTKTTYVQQQQIHSLSPVIVLSLNKYFGKKLIQYPPMIQFGDKATYVLIGTIEHFGGLSGGHYISRVRRLEDGAVAYYIIDDTKVIPITEETFFKSVPETYMVFYERVYCN